jgi:hypothetical protein
MKEILDKHFLPMIPESWSETFSLYEIGAIPEEDKIKEVIVWARTADIMNHLTGLMVPAAPMMVVDTVNRARLDKEQGWPRKGGETVMVRLMKVIDDEPESPISMLVELFQVYASEDCADEALGLLNKLFDRNHLPS